MMSKKVTPRTLTYGPQTPYRHLKQTNEEFMREVERLQNTLQESKLLLQKVAQLDRPTGAPPAMSYSSSTFLIAILLLALDEQNDQVEMLHKQVAGHTKKLCELSEQVQESDRQLKSSRKILDQIFAEVATSTNLLDPKSVEVVTQRVIRIIRDQKNPQPRSRRKRLRSLKRPYGTG